MTFHNQILQQLQSQLATPQADTIAQCQRQIENAPAWFNSLAHLDQLLATWEWRSGPTPWLVMKVRG